MIVGIYDATILQSGLIQWHAGFILAHIYSIAGKHSPYL